LTNVVLNARLAKEDLRETIAALKQEPGKALLVLGSGKTRLGSRASWIA